MKVIASVWTIAQDQSKVTAYTDRVAAGSLIAYVVQIKGLFYFMSSDDDSKIYGEGEYVSAAVRPKMAATVAARRHFGRNILVA
jgi:hypothetical protein